MLELFWILLSSENTANFWSNFSAEISYYTLNKKASIRTRLSPISLRSTKSSHSPWYSSSAISAFIALSYNRAML